MYPVIPQTILCLQSKTYDPDQSDSNWLSWLEKKQFFNFVQLKKTGGVKPSSLADTFSFTYGNNFYMEWASNRET